MPNIINISDFSAPELDVCPAQRKSAFKPP